MHFWSNCNALNYSDWFLNIFPYRIWFSKPNCSLKGSHNWIDSWNVYMYLKPQQYASCSPDEKHQKHSNNPWKSPCMCGCYVRDKARSNALILEVGHIPVLLWWFLWTSPFASLSIQQVLKCWSPQTKGEVIQTHEADWDELIWGSHHQKDRPIYATPEYQVQSVSHVIPRSYWQQVEESLKTSEILYFLCFYKVTGLAHKSISKFPSYLGNVQY